MFNSKRKKKGTQTNRINGGNSGRKGYGNSSKTGSWKRPQFSPGKVPYRRNTVKPGTLGQEAGGGQTWIESFSGGLKTVGKVALGVSKAITSILGTDFISTISSIFSSSEGKNSYAQPGDVLMSIPLNPKQIQSTRLQTMGSLYEKFLFRKCSIRYTPIAPSTTVGQLVGYVEYDVENQPPESGEQNLKRAFASYKCKPFQVWQSGSWPVEIRDPTASYYMDEDPLQPRLANQARFILMAASEFTTELSLGTINIEYAAEFYYPRVDTEGASGSWYSVVSGSSPSYSNIMGTSPVVSPTSNLDVTYEGKNTFSLPAGSYMGTIRITSSALSDWDMSATEGATIGYTDTSYASHGDGSFTVYSTSPCQILFTMDNTDVLTSVIVNIAAIPNNPPSSRPRKCIIPSMTRRERKYLDLVKPEMVQSKRYCLPTKWEDSNLPGTSTKTESEWEDDDQPGLNPREKIPKVVGESDKKVTTSLSSIPSSSTNPRNTR